MKIERLIIENFKSIERIELIKPNPFTVFVGPNGSGKSNIFEGLDFNITSSYNLDAVRLYGGFKYLQNRRLTSDKYTFKIRSDSFLATYQSDYPQIPASGDHVRKIFGPFYKQVGGELLAYDGNKVSGIDFKTNQDNYRKFVETFSRIFIGNGKLQKQNYSDDSRLNLSCSNLEQVLRRVLRNEIFHNEIFEWLELFVPSFKAVEVDERNELQWFEKSSVEHFTKDLISDGTYNILALLTAIYQSEEPQFLCIEEPENGLHPDVIKEFVNLCRYANKQFGHYIWLNTHSQTLASQLTADEIVVVDKVNGATQVKQFTGRDFHGLRMDEAWLMNALGGGLPW